MAATAEKGAASDTRERILRAALATFSEYGFDGATTREIASRAGVNLGLIAYYFDGKLALWRAAVDRAFATLGEALAGSADDAVLDERARTERVIRRYVHFVAANPEFVRLMHDEGKRRGPRMRWLVDRHARPFFEATTGMLARAQARGMLPPHIAPFHFFYVLVGAVGIPFHQAEECRRLTGVDLADPAVIDTHADAVIQLLLGPEEST